jgi:uncharacterized protein (DUF2384 family)
MKKEDLIHIKLDYDEALYGKKNVLSVEASLIKIAQAIQKYKMLRMRELELKKTLDEKSSLLRADLKKVKTTLPKMQLPKIVKKFEEKRHEEEKKAKIPKEKKSKKKTKKTKKVEPVKEDLGAQLQDIQDKLAKLG